MGSQPPADERHIDRDGITRIQKPRTSTGLWIVGLALGFTVLCVIASVWLLSTPSASSGDSAPAPLTRVAENTPGASPPPSRPMAAPSAPRPVTRTPAAAPTTAPEAPPPDTQTSTASEPKEGLHLYRQGTRPLKQGLVVPENFPLPPGYVRHYQSTDNGEQLKPILMFHEDYKPVDANGTPIELPSNRVVPPEMAPAGMPIEVLELPAGPEGVEPIP